MKNRKGYLLYEMCLVLFVVSAILLLFPLPSRRQEELILSDFVYMLESDIIYTKYHSSTSLDRYDIYLYPNDSKYVIYRGLLPIKRVEIDARIEWMDTFPSHRIRIYRGLLDQGGEILIRCGNSSYHLTIQPKGGVLVVQKQTGDDVNRTTDLRHAHSLYINPCDGRVVPH